MRKTSNRLIIGDALEELDAFPDNYFDVAWAHPYYWWEKEGPMEKYEDYMYKVTMELRRLAHTVFWLHGDSNKTRKRGLPWFITPYVVDYNIWYDTTFDQIHFIFQLNGNRITTGQRLYKGPFEAKPGYEYVTDPKPLVRTFLEECVGEGMKVIDPFAGSGTTGEVANELGADFVGIDIEKYD